LIRLIWVYVLIFKFLIHLLLLALRISISSSVVIVIKLSTKTNRNPRRLIWWRNSVIDQPVVSVRLVISNIFFFIFFFIINFTFNYYLFNKDIFYCFLMYFNVLLDAGSIGIQKVYICLLFYFRMNSFLE